jgi:hypothetical protein
VGRKINVTIIDGKPTDFYHWELVMPTVIINQLNEAEKPKSHRIDPTKPPSEYGAPQSIRLVPHKPHVPEVSMAIPPRSSPVYFCLRGGVIAGDATATGVAGFAIGFRVGDKRTYKFVEPATGRVIDTMDTVPKSKS